MDQDQDNGQEAQEQEPVVPHAVRDALEKPAPETGAVDTAPDADPNVPPVVEPAPDAEVEDPAAEALAALARFEQPQQAQTQQPAAQGLDPRVLAQAFREAVEASPQSRLVAEALQRQQQAMDAPRPPAEPGPEATVADWQRYTAQAVDFAVRSSVAPVQQQLQSLQQTFGNQLQQIQQTFQQQQQAQQRQAYVDTVNNAIDGLSRRPSYAWLQEDPLRAEIVKMTYERARGQIPLEQVVQSVGRSFGMLPAAPQQRAQQDRAASTAALAEKRAKAQSAPVRPAAGGKAPPTKQSNEERLRKNGMWDSMPEDLKELNRMRDRRAMN